MPPRAPPAPSQRRPRLRHRALRGPRPHSAPCAASGYAVASFATGSPAMACTCSDSRRALGRGDLARQGLFGRVMGTYAVTPTVAFVTISYGPDRDRCVLLRRSMEALAPSVEHW